MIRPIETMSISTVIMMNGIAAWRRARAEDGLVASFKGFLGGRHGRGAPGLRVATRRYSMR
jgi:hypothetical protein